MKIASGVDWSQFEINGEFNETSKQMFADYAKAYFDAMEEARPAISAGICGMKGRINEKLQEHSAKSYEGIVNLTESVEYRNVAQYDYELKCFQTAVRIYQRESGQPECIFDRLEYTEHFLAFYEKMLFYFRRIQLHLAKPLQLELMRYLRERNISVIAVVQMLLDCEIGGKEEIALSLADLYKEQSMVNEAVYLLSVISENCRPAWLEMLSQKKVEMI